MRYTNFCGVCYQRVEKMFSNRVGSERTGFKRTSPKKLVLKGVVCFTRLIEISGYVLELTVNKYLKY